MSEFTPQVADGIAMPEVAKNHMNINHKILRQMEARNTKNKKKKKKTNLECEKGCPERNWEKTHAHW